MRLPSLLAFLCLTLPAVFTNAAEGPSCYTGKDFFLWDYPRCEVLQDGKFVLYWHADKEKNTITFGVDVLNGGGWAGVGISQTGGMKGADIVVGRTVDGTFIVEDRHAHDFVTPTKDLKQNVELLWGKQQDGRTMFAFKRSLDNCADEEQDYDVDDDAWRETKVIFAYSSSNDFKYHAHTRGTVNLHLMAESEDFKVDDDTLTIDMVAPNSPLDGSSTQYLCSLHPAPKDTKYHVVAGDPIVAPENGKKHLVHHMILFACNQGTTPTTIVEGESLECGDQMIAGCQIYWMGWAMGGGQQKYPPAAGLPMGKTSYEYFVLQVHYDNPEGVVTTDSSGFRLHYTSKLRPNDIGVMTLGTVTEKISIPPGETSFEYSNICPMQCTNKLPSSGITVIGNMLHMHKIGVSITTSLIRSGEELPSLGKLDHYDFNMQSVLKQDAVILPGDQLITTCTYDSTQQTEVTLGGESTKNEMCFAFLLYYPDVGLRRCLDVTGLRKGLNGMDAAICPVGPTVTDDVKDGLTFGITRDPGTYTTVSKCGKSNTISGGTKAPKASVTTAESSEGSQSPQSEEDPLSNPSEQGAVNGTNTKPKAMRHVNGADRSVAGLGVAVSAAALLAFVM